MAIDGGIAPLVIAGIKVVVTGLVSGACYRLGEAAYDEVKSWF